LTSAVGFGQTSCTPGPDKSQRDARSLASKRELGILARDWHGRPGPAGRNMQSERVRELREQLARLREEHRDLDKSIADSEASSERDQLTLSRLKKRKLRLKDQIKLIEDQLLPDIIA
jgi:hypothetical protein